MIPLLIIVGLFIVYAKSQHSSSAPIPDAGSGISHSFAQPRASFVTERMAPWGSNETLFDFSRTTDPSIPASGGGITPTYPTAVSNIRIGGIARVSGGGSFQ